MLSERGVIRCVRLEAFHQRCFANVAQVELDNVPSPLFLVRFLEALFQCFFGLLLIELLLNDVKPQAAERIIRIVLIKRQQIILR
ncbi:Uncharacterised protein [Enterobacter cloacae]|nr:Uncharacterised protein [Enterobacter cloacae]